MAAQEEEDTTAILQSVKIPPPHSRPPASLQMSTRDSNRMKRFSAYGAIDTAAALAGQQKALIAAAFAQEDDDGHAKENDGDGNEEEDADSNIDITIADTGEVLRSDDIAYKQPFIRKKQTAKKTIRKTTTVDGKTVEAEEEDEEGDNDVERFNLNKNLNDEATIRALINLSIGEDSRPPVPSLQQLGEVSPFYWRKD